MFIDKKNPAYEFFYLARTETIHGPIVFNPGLISLDGDVIRPIEH